MCLPFALGPRRLLRRRRPRSQAWACPALGPLSTTGRTSAPSDPDTPFQDFHDLRQQGLAGPVWSQHAALGPQRAAAPRQHGGLRHRAASLTAARFALLAAALDVTMGDLRRLASALLLHPRLPHDSVSNPDLRRAAHMFTRR